MRFWGRDRLVVQLRTRWHVLSWPDATQLETGRGRISPEPNGDRAVVLHGRRLSWLDGAPVLRIPLAAEPSSVNWDGAEALVVIANAPPEAERAKDEPTVEVFGSSRSDGMSLWRYPLDGTEPRVLVQVPAGETLAAPTSLDSGIAFEHRIGPWNNQDLSWRIRVVDRIGGESMELLPDAAGLLSDLAPSPKTSRLAFRSSNPPLPYWWQIRIVAQDRIVTPLPDDLIAGIPVWAPNGDIIGATAFEGIRVGAIAFPADGRDWRWVVSPDGHCYCIAFAADGEMVFAWSGMDSAISIYRLDGEDRIHLFELEPAPTRKSVRRLVSWSAAGTNLEGILDVPKKGSPPWPTVVDLHGGPDYSMTLNLPNNLIPLDWWCEKGFAAFAPDYRGSGIAGKEAKFVANRFKADSDGGSEWADVLAGVDALVSDGLCDPTRLFLFGFSHGGWLVGRLLAEDHRFRAAATWEAYGVDFRMDYGLMGGNPMTRSLFGGNPWQVPESYQEASLMSYIHLIRTSILLLRGDPNTFGSYSTKVWHTALREHGVDTELVFYPGEEHVVKGQANLQDVATRCIDWFNRHSRS